MIYVGIDPGVTGAMAKITPHRVEITDVPTRLVNNKKELDPFGLHVLWYDHYYPKVAIEKVGTMPTDGRVGAFSFGKGYGIWLGVLGAEGIEPVEVSPLAWKREFGLLGENKEASRKKAIELFPQLADQLKRVKDHNRAEALLIAEWLRRQDVKNVGEI